MAKIFLKNVFHKHIHLHIDNQVALFSLRAQGSTRSPLCNKFTAKIMRFFEEHDLHLTVTYIKSGCNVEADLASRATCNDDIEWSLKQNVFDELCEVFGRPQVDLFATRLNFKLPSYVAWQRDPGAVAIDALYHDWNQYAYVYLYPCFSLIPRVIRKFQLSGNGLEGLFIIPFWPGQIWWPVIMDLVMAPIVVLPPIQNCLYLPHKPQQQHPLKKLSLLAVRITNSLHKQQNFLQQLSTQSTVPSHRIHTTNIMHIGKDGGHIVTSKGKIPITRLQ